ncbi:MAG: Uma2 family endonuclease [Anaerolineae bacterium]|nr:Uma2 family endonuclease [Anaerolineae bacterium]
MTTVTQPPNAPAPPRTKWTTADLALLPDNGRRYEIIDGELYMSKQPHWHHEQTIGLIFAALQSWSEESGLGQVSPTPGVIFGEMDNVVPDVVWISNERLNALLDAAGHLLGAPELVVEVLSYGGQNEDRDRKLKLKLYESHGVQEYWIADWRLKQMEVYRRDAGQLKFVSVFLPADTLTSPLLPGFACQVRRLFPRTT